MTDAPHDRPGLLRRIWRWLTTPSGRWSTGGLLGFGIVAGIIFWGGFHTVLEATNTTQFACPAMRWRRMSARNGRNPAITRTRRGCVGCPDCHVPKDWGPKILRKIHASNELYHHFLGTINTPEKFEANRKEMAERVWEGMKKTDSRECRNCHSYDAMAFHKQTPRGAEKMQEAAKKGETCIDCHKGIAHQLPKRDD